MNVFSRQKDLRHGMVVFGKQLVVNIHQLALPHGGRGLLGGHIIRPFRKIELSDAHGDGAGGYEDDFVPGVFDIAEDLAEGFHAADIHAPGGMRQIRRTDLYGDSHIASPWLIMRKGNAFPDFPSVYNKSDPASRLYREKEKRKKRDLPLKTQVPLAGTLILYTV